MAQGNSNNFNLNTREFCELMKTKYKADLTPSYFRLIIHRIQELGILVQQIGDNRGNRKITFNLDFKISDLPKNLAVTRHFKTLCTNLMQRGFTPSISPVARTFSPDREKIRTKLIQDRHYQDEIEKRTYKNICTITGEITEHLVLSTTGGKRKDRSRLFQSHDFKSSYKALT